ncbi:MULTISPECIES: CRISPR-associated endonuclease Cas2 [Brevibacillus]|jgi:CRISPR-associated protein Cas2|uniref:CRISPR-associated endoribonuclease Cas2 n=2 Tax=Brevibacillus parabrevis TaxID=54914 RepID=A0A4Y3PQZ2_BREPA|nr:MULTISPECIES: CRISPR-associated endonuclease Cas2 [Brevibacillus]TGV29121.1 CRISPR-associated endonuclease Cas2 [Mesorhizobium sp. M00.F.Ca.ET.186.01.1.1]MBU8712522.1 CRISPR-associated endonuclease Cas2 [Brevibacillus parabrevis]MDH6353464.1 CRISPR-associated protein Cas2 [Brevibacillus sp. 1238]MDR5000141.1 CRISPR-associated endonuclease Cas2 [Brevibacillus parabrevis]MED1721169.1 CRISPR-associated endonuclease Cas2 [Brevibacillus parabrevis]
MRHFVLVSYDISDQKRWRKVFKLMKGQGEHVQYSVFLCQLTEIQQVKLKVSLAELIHHAEDQVMFVKIGPVTKDQLDKRIATVGREFLPRDLTKFIY